MENLAVGAPGLATGKERVTTTRHKFDKEEVVVFERCGELIRVLDQEALEKRRELEKIRPRKVLVPLDRNPFVLATGSSETELLGTFGMIHMEDMPPSEHSLMRGSFQVRSMKLMKEFCSLMKFHILVRSRGSS